MDDVAALTKLINNDLFRALNIRGDGWLGRRLYPFLARAAKPFSEIFLDVDRITGERGLTEGARSLLTHFVNGVDVQGTGNIPHEGPLVVASNHPGTVDSVAITSGVPRSDFKIIAAEMPFLQHLPNISKHMIYSPYNNAHARIKVVREAIRHLQGGGALLIFPRGGIEPDPSFMSHARETLSLWSRSLELFLDRVPQCRMLVTIVSGVIKPRYMRYPITWLWRKTQDRQRLAMTLQVIEQLNGKKINITPRVTFGDLVSEESAGGKERVLPAILNSARNLISCHESIN